MNLGRMGLETLLDRSLSDLVALAMENGNQLVTALMQQPSNLIPARLGELFRQQTCSSAAVMLPLNRVDPNRIAKQKVNAAIDNGGMPATAVEQWLCRIKQAEKLQWSQVVLVFIG